MNFLDDFSKVNALVVGDVMLDRYWWGDVSRISPEAPVPVVNLKNITLAAGGAANVATNVAGLGANPILVGITGSDADGLLFSKVLKEKKVSAKFLFKIPNRPTTVKTRVIGHNQQIVRIDQETNENLSKTKEDEILETIEILLEKVNIIIISDYGKGFLTESFLSRLITSAIDKRIIVIVDPKGKRFEKYKGANIITPNKFEVAEAYRLENQKPATIEECGRQIIKKLRLDALLVTQGEEGMTLFQKNGALDRLPASAREVYDVTGAGDTVIACLGVGLASGLNYLAAAEIANTAAGLIVEQLGTTAVTVDMLKKTFAAKE